MGVCLFVNITLEGWLALCLVPCELGNERKQKNEKNLFEFLLKFYINTGLLNNISLINSNYINLLVECLFYFFKIESSNVFCQHIKDL